VTCAEFEDRVIDIGRDECEVESLNAHAAACHACAALLERERKMASSLRAAAATGCAPDRLEPALLAAFDRQHPRVLSKRRAGMACTAAAALIVLALTYSLLPRVGQTSTSARDLPVAPSNAQVAPSISNIPAVAVPPLPSPPHPKRHPQRTPALARRLRPAPPDPAPPVEFIALPSAAALPPPERGQILRVEMPRSALPGFGIPVIAASGDTIRADIIIGEDSLARAIRLVDSNNGNHPNNSSRRRVNYERQ
jgi:hypothetical protein